MFGLGLLAAIWGGAGALLYADYSALRAKGEVDAGNFAGVGGQSATALVRSAGDALRMLRWLDQGSRDWGEFFSDPSVTPDGAADVAVINAAGFVVASSRAPHPLKLVDVGAEPYFANQARATDDAVVVGAPVRGATGDVSAPISIRRVNVDGAFAGVFVYAAPADALAKAFAGFNFGAGGGLALVGDDKRIVLGAGALAGRAGERLDRALETLGDGFLSQKKLDGLPLTIVARAPGLEADAGWRARRAMVLAGALAATLLTLAVAIRMARRRAKFEREHLKLTRCDALTGLPNRVALAQELDGLCARRDVGFALHVLDLDRFKTVNDTYGHPVGDELLKLAAVRLRSLLRPEDFLARLGGDEFAILQRVDDFEIDGMALARRIPTAMAEPFASATARASADHPLSIGATVGVASGRRDGASAVELMQAADLALYAAKADGRGCARVFNRTLTEQTAARVELEAALRGALKRDEFRLDYQPIHSLRRKVCTGYEALLRWRRADGTLVAPNDFVPIAEDQGLILDIGAWVLRRACLDIAAQPGDLEVSVNVAPIQLDAGRVARDVREALRISGLAPQRLRIEITESAFLHDKPIVADQLHELREMGVGVSLDDFGTGYSCLSYLEMYPIDTLKIDQRFIAKLGERPEATATLRAIVDLARSYGMRTVGEGVETEAQLRVLLEIGCDRAQGFLLGRPALLPVVEARASAA